MQLSKNYHSVLLVSTLCIERKASEREGGREGSEREEGGERETRREEGKEVVCITFLFTT